MLMNCLIQARLVAESLQFKLVKRDTDYDITFIKDDNYIYFELNDDHYGYCWREQPKQ